MMLYVVDFVLCINIFDKMLRVNFLQFFNKFLGFDLSSKNSISRKLLRIFHWFLFCFIHWYVHCTTTMLKTPQLISSPFFTIWYLFMSSVTYGWAVIGSHGPKRAITDTKLLSTYYVYIPVEFLSNFFYPIFVFINQNLCTGKTFFSCGKSALGERSLRLSLIAANKFYKLFPNIQ